MGAVLGIVVVAAILVAVFIVFIVGSAREEQKRNTGMTVMTAAQHRAHGKYLLNESLTESDPSQAAFLREQSKVHFDLADLLDAEDASA